MYMYFQTNVPFFGARPPTTAQITMEDEAKTSLSFFREKIDTAHSIVAHATIRANTTYILD